MNRIEMENLEIANINYDDESGYMYSISSCLDHDDHDNNNNNDDDDDARQLN
ncbi:hypothetical protein DERF_004517 [Dermatophagoides farinae]|uniref:Uncharacterized protein n=1 Tax=Dermatophagoides farinae TaxID=6954 RepID=A0A922I4Z1_DERFA|nr:hypothetical protein DERF_004517 [Dermatophagoides farinae]